MALADFASLCTTAALLGAVSAALVVLINQEQPQPYMVSLSLTSRDVILSNDLQYDITMV